MKQIGPLAPSNLRCEYCINPLGVDKKNPRLSWFLSHSDRGEKQSAYQVIVSSSLEKLNDNIGDIWDSGKVLSNSQLILYDGAPLESKKRYYWKVRWWDSKDRVSPFSEVAIFEMGLIEESDWKAKWIGRKEYEHLSIEAKDIPFARSYTIPHSALFRKDFFLKGQIKRARTYISGLGLYELYINGCRIGDKVLDPGQTDYKKKVLYSTYDVTSILKEGKNAIGVILGNGRYVMDYGYDFPKLILQLEVEYADGSSEIITSDETWKTSYGPILANGIYYGEVYDARREISGWNLPEFDDSGWEQVKLVEPPGGKLVSELMPPIKVIKTLKPERIINPKPGVYVYDFGQNFTGWARLYVKGPEGIEIRLRFAELIDETGNINVLPNRGASATDVYITKGEGIEIYEPRFTYHGFRYVEITGFPGVPTLDNLEGRVVHSSVEPVGEFICSNELINKIHRNVLWGQLSNLMSVPTDCPQRDERMGWTGDAQLTVEEAIYNFDMAAFYLKYLDDIKLAQKEDGSVSDVVPPYWSLYPADPAWGTAYMTIAWYLFQYYGDVEVLREHYEGLKKYVEFLSSLAPDNILRFSKYGDWCPPGSIRPKDFSGELVSTWCYYNDTLTLAKIAKVLGKEEDYSKYSKLAEDIKSAFNKRYLKDRFYAVSIRPDIPEEVASKVLEAILSSMPPDQRERMKRFIEQNLSFTSLTSQTINTLPLYLDIVPEDKKEVVLKSLIDDIVNSHDYHLDTGIVGTRYIFDVLTENGYVDIAYKIATQESYPSWGYMIKEGATTVWERWEKLTSSGMNSHNHIMFGTVDSWFYKALGGIKCVAPGWDKVIIAPSVIGDLKYVKAGTRTPKGYIEVDWEKLEDSVCFIISIPTNIEGEIRIPKLYKDTVIEEGRRKLWSDGALVEKIEGIYTAREEKDYISFSVGSGRFVFKVSSK